jgi:hypothetical protein
VNQTRPAIAGKHLVFESPTLLNGMDVLYAEMSSFVGPPAGYSYTLIPLYRVGGVAQDQPGDQRFPHVALDDVTGDVLIAYQSVLNGKQQVRYRLRSATECAGKTDDLCTEEEVPYNCCEETFRPRVAKPLDASGWYILYRGTNCPFDDDDNPATPSINIPNALMVNQVHRAGPGWEGYVVANLNGIDDPETETIAPGQTIGVPARYDIDRDFITWTALSGAVHKLNVSHIDESVLP